MSTDTPVMKDHPLSIAWDLYKTTEPFKNTERWIQEPEHRIGSMWAVFENGWNSRNDQLQTLTAERDELKAECERLGQECHNFDEFGICTLCGYDYTEHQDLKDESAYRYKVLRILLDNDWRFMALSDFKKLNIPSLHKRIAGLEKVVEAGRVHVKARDALLAVIEANPGNSGTWFFHYATAHAAYEDFKQSVEEAKG